MHVSFDTFPTASSLVEHPKVTVPIQFSPPVKMPGLNGAIHQLSNWTQLNPNLLGIYKEYVKAAIRTNPHDLLLW